MIIVRSCGTIHEFEADEWDVNDRGVLFVSNEGLPVASFYSWTSVNYPNALLSSRDVVYDCDEPESDSVPGTPLASCGDNPAMI